MRLRPNSVFFTVGGGRRSGYTLVEILVATTLTLILMTAVVSVFAGVGDGIAKSRRAMEQFDRLRTTAQQLRLDLQGVTVTLNGRPTRPEESQGYFEYIEGGILSLSRTDAATIALYPTGVPGVPLPINDQLLTTSGSQDLTVGERGDILMFTTRNASRPFLGRYALNVDPANPTLQSDVAEVAWFLRGKTLHRRVLLVAPGVNQNPNFANLPWLLRAQNPPSAYYASNDISARLVGGQFKNNGWPTLPTLVANSLADLTKRENRFAHVHAPPSSPPYQLNSFPFDVRYWGVLGLPTLAECSSLSWMLTTNPYTGVGLNWVTGSTPPLPSLSPVPPSILQMDYWDDAGPAGVTTSFANLASALGVSSGTAATPEQFFATDGTRLADDVVLTNVIGFDVKAWDPGAPVRSFPDPATGQPVVVKPGDPRYSEALRNQLQRIVSYGAYVDLGWRLFDSKYPNQNVPGIPVNDPVPGIAPNYLPVPKFWSLNNCSLPTNQLNPYGYGFSKSGLDVIPQGLLPAPTLPTPLPLVYDSYSFSYENEGVYNFKPDPNNNGAVGPKALQPSNNSVSYPQGLGKWPAGTSTNGLDDDNDGVVDDASELITQPPYPVPLRGIQVTIRCYEPDSRQIRQITIENDFLPK